MPSPELVYTFLRIRWLDFVLADWASCRVTGLRVRWLGFESVGWASSPLAGLRVRWLGLESGDWVLCQVGGRQWREGGPPGGYAVRKARRKSQALTANAIPIHRMPHTTVGIPVSWASM